MQKRAVVHKPQSDEPPCLRGEAGASLVVSFVAVVLCE